MRRIFSYQIAESIRLAQVVTGRRRFADLVALLPLSRDALAFAEQRHAGQRAADGSPFIRHPIEVASLLYDAGAPDHVVAAGVLHDIVEKGGTEAAELVDRFGPGVASLVIAVSEDPEIRGYAARKAALRARVATAGRDVLLLFAADKLSKTRELRRAARRRGSDSASVRRKLAHYRRSAELLSERLADHPLVLALNAELAKLPVAPRKNPAFA